MASTHLAVLGSPIEHSKSPVIHTAAYDALGLDWDYGRYRIESNELSDFLAKRDSTWRGLSLTMPLKEVGHELSIPSCPVASATGVVNTLVHTEAGWEGYNTDSFGIMKSVQVHTDKAFEAVQILGSGATARSAVNAARELYPEASISVFARKAGKVLGISAKPLEDFYSEKVEGLTISTLPSTVMIPGFETSSEATILDVSYDPWPSKLSANWLPENRISGIEMLLWQALIQVRLFVNGDGTHQLDDEASVFEAMSSAVKQR